MAALPLKSSRTDQRAVVETVDSLGLEVLPHPTCRPDLAPSDIIFLADEENAGWTEICRRYGDAVDRSFVACAAANFVFLHWAFTKLLKDGTNV